MPTAMPPEPLTSRLGNFARQHGRLGVPFVVGGDEVDRIELEVFEHLRREGRQAGFGVPHGGRRQAGDRAEVALLVDQHVPHVPILGHADERGVDDAFAVRMVVTARVAGDLRALHAARAGREIQVVHRHQNPPLRGLEAVAHVGQRPAHDHAHRVREVALLELVFDRQVDQPRGNRLCLRIFGRGGIIRTGGHKQILSTFGEPASAGGTDNLTQRRRGRGGKAIGNRGRTLMNADGG